MRNGLAELLDYYRLRFNNIGQNSVCTNIDTCIKTILLNYYMSKYKWYMFIHGNNNDTISQH